MILAESGIEMSQVEKCSQHQAGADQQHARQPHLRNHEGAAQAAWCRPAVVVLADFCKPCLGSVREACRAGINPNRTPVTKLTSAVNASTGPLT